MKKSSRMDIEYKLNSTFTIQFRELNIGDVFRVVDENRLYMVVQMPPSTLLTNQGVSLENGGRRRFNDNAACIQVKMICSWVDIQP